MQGVRRFTIEFSQLPRAARRVTAGLPRALPVVVLVPRQTPVTPQLSKMLPGTTLLASAVLVAFTLHACGDRATPSHRPLLGCGAPGDEVVSMAVTEYLKKVTPPPKRFLVSVGTDSALPDAAGQALQDKGPTFLYPADPGQQTVVRKQLAAKGNFPTLLIAYHGLRQLDDTRAVVRVGGHFVGGAEDGRAAPSGVIYFQCDTARWHVVRAEEERSS
jgi:hypothetical protein